jgi:hypothetical protein
MRYGAAAIVRGASVHNRRKCVLTGYGRTKLAAMLESNRRCAKNVLYANVVRLFIPTDACSLCARTMLVKSVGSTAKKWGGWWPRTLRKLPSGGRFNGTLSTLGYEAQRDAGSTGEVVGHTQAPPSEGDLVLRNADRGCTCSKTFRSDACGGQFSMGQAAEWHDVTSDSFG